jgi:hypothetical protein
MQLILRHYKAVTNRHIFRVGRGNPVAQKTISTSTKYTYQLSDMMEKKKSDVESQR